MAWRAVAAPTRNADVVRQELEREHGITVSLRMVEHAAAPLRRELRAAEVATIRSETAPGHLQIDFGETTVAIDSEWFRGHLFLATLGYSRRPYVTVFNQSGSRLGGRGSKARFTISAVARVRR